MPPQHKMNKPIRCVGTEVVDESLTAWLLPDLGKLKLVTKIADEYGRVTTSARDKKVPLWEAELEKAAADKPGGGG